MNRLRLYAAFIFWCFTERPYRSIGVCLLAAGIGLAAGYWGPW